MVRKLVPHLHTSREMPKKMVLRLKIGYQGDIRPPLAAKPPKEKFWHFSQFMRRGEGWGTPLPLFWRGMGGWSGHPPPHCTFFLFI